VKGDPESPQDRGVEVNQRKNALHQLIRQLGSNVKSTQARQVPTVASIAGRTPAASQQSILC